MGLQDLISKIQGEGWNVNQEYINDNCYQSAHTAINNLINADLKYAGVPCLPSTKSLELLPPLVLQVTNVRNVAAPKANEESQFAPRMLKITLTDGKGFIQGLEIEHIKSLSLKTAPGTKIKIVSRVTCVSGYYLLSQSNVLLLGGVVEDLFDKWKISKDALKYSRGKPSSDGTGPPPWVPFGKGILSVEETDENFKALSEVASKPKDDKFQESRNEVVSKLAQESSNKVFGGGKQMLDTNVQKIINAGFSTEQAQEALCSNRNNLDRAFQQLKRPFQSNDEPAEDSFRARGRGRRGGRGRGSRSKRDVSGPDGSDDEMYTAPSSRPSGPVSLSDFLEIKVKSQNVCKGDTVYTQQLRELNRYDKSREYEAQLRELNRYSKNNTQYERHTSSNNQASKYNRIGADSFQNEFHKLTSSQEQSYQKRNYDTNTERGNHYGNNYFQRGKGSHGTDGNGGRGNRHSNNFPQKIKSNNYDKDEKGNQYAQNDYENYENQHSGNYECRKHEKYNKETSEETSCNYQTDRCVEKNSGNFFHGNNQTSRYRGDNYNKKDSANYHNYEEKNYNSDRGKPSYAGHQGRGNSSYGGHQGRGKSSYVGHQDRGNSSRHHETGKSSNEGQQNRGNYPYIDKQNKNSYFVKDRYEQEHQVTGKYTACSKTSNQTNNDKESGSRGSGKRVYTDKERNLIGQFRQSLEISGDYQPESHFPLKTDDYYSEENTAPQMRSQRGTVDYHRRGLPRATRSRYQNRYSE